ncbi:LuxR family transcriptional regulator [Sulfitobacter sp. SK012]|uniref:helix-turn-helix transcriptional regulator n=1 Tax=Sulfitobacter sp. SK012 TaxID=1389005 RepID=UPI000E0B1557|nr:LuxR family transcriptional regulator [Sulfitobacter sp. SK012]AXI45419.1 LuxR family transcriptional regulator [Sulfitobacter sp. SK012]
MAEKQSLSGFLAQCRSTQTTQDLWHDALDFFHGCGIAMVSYHMEDAERPGGRSEGFVEDGFPEAWICHYIEAELLLVDPLPQLARQLGRPFLWSEMEKLTTLSKAGRAFMHDRAELVTCDGIAMQVFGPNLRNAHVALGFAEGMPVLKPEEIFELQCAAHIAHIRYCELTEVSHETPTRLSPRELEILRWIARGKSNSVIAEILGISRHTVDTMARRVFEKLDVNDRTTAAIRGLGSGLLHYRDGAVV